MRLYLTLSPNTKPVPFNYQHQLTGALHNWLGQNDLHDKISLYSFSWLRGRTVRVDGGLNFPNGATWFISFWEESNLKELIRGILNQPAVFYGCTVKDIQIQETPNFEQKAYFRVASPILVRENLDNGGRKHLTFNDSKTKELLNQRFRSKLNVAGLTTSAIISFDETYHSPKTKLVQINKSKLKTSICPVIIEGDTEAIQFAWNVGVGELTGSGMGALI